jgi:hypothetical protein
MADIDLSLVPAKVTITNSTGKKIKVNCSGFCQSVPVENNQAVIFKAESSSELIGFLSQEAEGLAVEYEYWTAPQP